MNMGFYNDKDEELHQSDLSTKNNAIAAIVMIIAVVIIALAAILVPGCNGLAKGQYNTIKSKQYNVDVQFEEDGRPVVKTFIDQGNQTNSRGEVQSPPGAKEPGSLVMNDTGFMAALAGTYAPAAIDYVKKNQGNLIYIGIAIAIAGLACSVVPYAKVVGLSAMGPPLIVFGAATCFLPTVIEYAGPWLAGVLVICVVGLVLAGVVWWIAKRKGKGEAFRAAKERGNQTAAVLVGQGDTNGAVAARVATDPSYAKAYVAGKVATATADAIKGDPLAAIDPVAGVPIVPTVK